MPCLPWQHSSTGCFTVVPQIWTHHFITLGEGFECLVTMQVKYEELELSPCDLTIHPLTHHASHPPCNNIIIIPPSLPPILSILTMQSILIAWFLSITLLAGCKRSLPRGVRHLGAFPIVTYVQFYICTCFHLILLVWINLKLCGVLSFCILKSPPDFACFNIVQCLW